MWQLLWMFDFLPDMLWHILLIVSALMVFLAAFFKFVPYRMPVGVFSILVLAMSLFMEGSISNEAKWLAEIDKLKAELAVYEKKSLEKNIEIQEKVVEKTRVVEKKGETIIKTLEVPGPERIKEITKDMTTEQRAAYDREIEELKTVIASCPIPKQLIDAHNQAASNPFKDAAKGEKK